MQEQANLLKLACVDHPRRPLTDSGAWRRGPGGERLAATVRTLVLDGRIAVGTRLPAERALAGALAVSRATVTAAYDRLRAEGYSRARRAPGAG